MFTRYKTEGVALSQNGKGEADRRITFFSREFGRIEVVGKGMRKIDSKLRSETPLFSLARIEFIQGRYFKILTFARALNDFREIKRNLPKLRVAYKLRDLVLGLVTEPQKDEKTWRFLLCRLEALAEIESEPPALKMFYFASAWRLLSLLGYAPRLYRCLCCGKSLSLDKRHVFQKGGAVCSRCQSRTRNPGFRMSKKCLVILRKMGKKDPSFSEETGLEENDFQEMENLLEFYVREI